MSCEKRVGDPNLFTVVLGLMVLLVSNIKYKRELHRVIELCFLEGHLHGDVSCKASPSGEASCCEALCRRGSAKTLLLNF